MTELPAENYFVVKVTKPGHKLPVPLREFFPGQPRVYNVGCDRGEIDKIAPSSATVTDVAQLQGKVKADIVAICGSTSFASLRELTATLLILDSARIETDAGGEIFDFVHSTVLKLAGDSTLNIRSAEHDPLIISALRPSISFAALIGDGKLAVASHGADAGGEYLTDTHTGEGAK